MIEAVLKRLPCVLLFVAAAHSASIALAADPATKPALPSDATVILRRATKIPDLESIRYEISISGLDSQKTGKLVGIVDEIIKSDAKLIESGNKAGANLPDLKKAAKANAEKLDRLCAPLVTPTDQGMLKHAHYVAQRESILMRADFSKDGISDPFPGWSKQLKLSADQVKKLDEIRAESLKLKNAVDDEREAVAQHDMDTKGESGDEEWWENESLTVGMRQAAKFRAILNKDQVKEWQSIMDTSKKS